LNRGLEGIIAIRGHLDCAFSWAQDDERMADAEKTRNQGDRNEQLTGGSGSGEQ